MATATINILNPPLGIGENEWIEIDWDSPDVVTGFALSEVSVTGATITDTEFLITGGKYYFSIQVPSGIGGRITIMIGEDVVDQGNDAASASFDWGAGPPEAVFEIAFDPSALTAGETTTATITADGTVTGLALADLALNAGTLSNFAGSGDTYTVDITAPTTGSGTMTLTIAADAVIEGNAETTADIAYMAAEPLTVTISGTTNITQGEQTTLTASVVDGDGNTPTGTIEYAWTASRGRFVGATNEAIAVYDANFTDGSDVDVPIECTARILTDATPTSSGPSLTALADIGITGILVNMYLTTLGAIVDPANSILYNNATGTLAAGSDSRLSSTIDIWQARWDNRPTSGTDDNDFALNNRESGSLSDFFNGNNNQSIYLLFEGGIYTELKPSDFEGAGRTWARWDVADAAIVALLDGLTVASNLVVGVADAGSIGFPGYRGSETETVVVSVPPPPPPVNTAPVFADTSYAFTDVARAIDTVVATIAATDADDDPLSYSLTGTDAGTFSIDANGQITVATALTYSESYNFNVVADDDTDTTSVPVTVTATAAPPPPPPADAILEITVNPNSVTAGSVATVTFTFDKAVGDFTATDVTVSAGATKGTLTDEGNNVWTLTVTAPSSGSGTVTVSVGADVVTPGNNADSVQFSYTAPPPPPPQTPPTFTAPASAYQVNERADDTIDSTEFFTGHTSLTFRSGYTAPSWLTISGLNVVITGAPDVVEDTELTVLLTATNSDGSVNGSITISVQQIDPAPIFGTPATHEVNEGGSSTVDLSGVLQNAESLAYQSGYTAPSWLTISGLTLVITNAEQVSQDTDFDVLLTAASTKTAATVDRTVTIRVRELTPPPPRVRSVPRFSTAPIDVKVELTPTTALMTWKAPTNGAALREYEIGYAEGASPGTDWIPTESLSTRFLVKGLKRATQYTWQVRGVTENGAGDASSPVTERTPIASLHNALFFKECVNYFDDGGRVSVHGDPTNLVRAVSDNNYRTFTREKDLVINIAVNGQPTRVDAIFVKGIDIEGHSAAPNGGTGVGYSNRMMPATVKNWEGTEVSTIVNGFQHDLYLLDPHFTATSVRMTFTGANAKIVEVMCLEFGISIDANGDFTEIATNFVDREGVVHPDPGGGIVYDPPIGADERDKWQVDYVVKIVPGKTLLETPEDFLYWRAENRNHVHAMEPSRFPLRIFPSVFMRKSVPIRYRTDSKTSGEILSFRVAEQ